MTPSEDEIIEAIGKLVWGILGALKKANVPIPIQMNVLGGCLAEVLRQLPEEAQLPALIDHVMALRSCGFEESIGVLPIAMTTKEKTDDPDDDSVTRH